MALLPDPSLVTLPGAPSSDDVLIAGVAPLGNVAAVTPKGRKRLSDKSHTLGDDDGGGLRATDDGRVIVRHAVVKGSKKRQFYLEAQDAVYDVSTGRMTQLPVPFKARTFQYDDDEACEFVVTKPPANHARQMENKVENVCNTGIQANAHVLAVYADERGHVSYAAPLDPKLLSNPGFARALLQMSLAAQMPAPPPEDTVDPPKRYVTEAYRDAGGYSDGINVLRKQAASLGYHLVITNDNNETPEVKIAHPKASKASQLSNDLREQLEPLRFALSPINATPNAAATSVAAVATDPHTGSASLVRGTKSQRRTGKSSARAAARRGKTRNSGTLYLEERHDDVQDECDDGEQDDDDVLSAKMSLAAGVRRVVPAPAAAAAVSRRRSGPTIDDEYHAMMQGISSTSDIAPAPLKPKAQPKQQPAASPLTVWALECVKVSAFSSAFAPDCSAIAASGDDTLNIYVERVVHSFNWNL